MKQMDKHRTKRRKENEERKQCIVLFWQAIEFMCS
jgi:hypothetical protein